MICCVVTIIYPNHYTMNDMSLYVTMICEYVNDIWYCIWIMNDHYDMWISLLVMICCSYLVPNMVCNMLSMWSWHLDWRTVVMLRSDNGDNDVYPCSSDEHISVADNISNRGRWTFTISFKNNNDAYSVDSKSYDHKIIYAVANAWLCVVPQNNDLNINSPVFIVVVASVLLVIHSIVNTLITGHKQ